MIRTLIVGGSGGGGAATPTGTGFVHVTSGVQDSAASTAVADSSNNGLMPATGPGANLTNADATIAIAAGRWRKLPAATLTADHVLTLSTTGCTGGETIRITRLDETAFQYSIVNGGAGAGTLFVMPVLVKSYCIFYFDGTNWSLAQFSSGIGLTSLAGQANIYIDSSAGSDTNTGITVGSPLKTHAEFVRRLSVGAAVNPGGLPRISASMTITIVSDLPSSDPVSMHATLAPGVQLNYVNGTTLTSVTTGTFTAVTLAQSGTNVPLSITDTAQGGTTWTTIGLKQRLRNTTVGANLTATYWLAKDLTSNAVRMSGGILSSGALGTATVGDTYVVETLRKIYLGDMVIRADQGAGTTTVGTIIFTDFEFASGGFGGIFQPKLDVFSRFNGCKFDGPVIFNSPAEGNLTLFYGCCFAGGYQQTSGASQFQGCLFAATKVLFQGGITQITGNSLFQGFGIIVGNASVGLGDVGIFDVTTQASNNPAGDAIFVCGSKTTSAAGGALSIATFQGAGGGHLVYGSGNAGVGINVSACAANANYETTVPTVTGTGGDLQLGSVKTGRSFDSSGTGVYSSAEISTTWANFTAAVGASGFGGYAHNLKQNVHFVKK